jgi:hypothetical protein
MAFTVMREEDLRTFQASIQEELDRRSLPPSAPERPVIKEFLTNLATGKMPSGATIETGGPDVHGTIATLSENAATLVRTFDDSAIQDGLELLGKWEDLTDESVKKMMAEAITGLVTHAIRTERDRRLQASASTG